MVLPHIHGPLADNFMAQLGGNYSCSTTTLTSIPPSTVEGGNEEPSIPKQIQS